jgi:hypothetical protein
MSLTRLTRLSDAQGVAALDGGRVHIAQAAGSGAVFVGGIALTNGSLMGLAMNDDASGLGLRVAPHPDLLPAQVTALAASPDGATLAVASAGKDVALHSPGDLTLTQGLSSVPGAAALAFHPEGTHL